MFSDAGFDTNLGESLCIDLSFRGSKATVGIRKLLFALERERIATTPTESRNDTVVLYLQGVLLWITMCTF